MVSLGLVAIGFAVFALAVRFLSIFPEHAHGPRLPAARETPAAGTRG